MVVFSKKIQFYFNISILQIIKKISDDIADHIDRVVDMILRGSFGELSARSIN